MLLPPLKPEKANKKCVVIDLDETLVHSSFRVRTTRERERERLRETERGSEIVRHRVVIK